MTKGFLSCHPNGMVLEFIVIPVTHFHLISAVNPNGMVLEFIVIPVEHFHLISAVKALQTY